MGEFLGSVWWLLVSLGILVTFHEYGHYIVGRLCGVKVLRFSIGFGTPFWRRHDRHGTEFALAPIPLGGYVKFLDEREDEVPVAERAYAFNNQSLGKRAAIVAAGPVANLLLALVAFWAMYLVGKQDFAPIVGKSDGIAAQAGVVAGDRLLSVDGQAVDTWTHAALRLITAGVDRRATTIQVAGADGQARDITLPLDRLSPDVKEPAMLTAAGLIPRQFVLPPVLGTVEEGKPGALAGLRKGDRIVAIDGTRIDDFEQVRGLIQRAGASGQALTFSIERDSRSEQIAVTPAAVKDNNGATPVYQVGIGPERVPHDYDALLRYGPIDAIAASGRETWTMTTSTLGMLWRMVAGRASLENLSGPITISQFANASARSGLGHFLWFLGVISLSLCIINLLPIPILDGGHLLYYLIELVKGSPVSENAMAAGQYIGLAALAGLMGLAFYNDIVRLVS